MTKQELAQLEDAKPVLRSVLAFLHHLRFGSSGTVSDCYATADRFIEEFFRDAKKAAK